MNKAQLIEAIAHEAEVSRTVARKSLDAFLKITCDCLGSGDRINLTGFGSFAVAKKPGRTGRNPRTGAAIKISPKNVVKFKAGNELNTKIQ